MLRGAIQKQVQQLLGSGGEPIDLDSGDGGLFGPGSSSWAVHGDFTAMMIGGVSALLLQMLHPAALAGVWDHSTFRKDMSGRLRRTAQFIAATTYGSTELAERQIARVRAIHQRVSGTLPDGTPYAASDPALLTWVHVAEADSFLRAHLRFRDPAMSAAAQDRYFDETAEVARRLGARDVPTDRRGAAAYLQALRPALRADARTEAAAAAILRQPVQAIATVPVRQVMMQAAIDLLPPWAAAMHGFPRRPSWHLTSAGVQGVGTLLRWAMRDGASKRAHRRVGAA